MSYLMFTAMLTSATSILLSAGGDGADTKTPMTCSEWGYLSRGPRRAVEAAVFALVECGALRITAGGGVTRDERLPADAPALERAIYDRVHIPVGMVALRRAPEVRQALRDLRASLVARGLMLSGWRRNAARATAVLAVVSVVAGLVSSVATADQTALHHTLGAAVLVALLIMLVLLWRSDFVTRAAGMMLRNMRSAYPKPTHSGADGCTDAQYADICVALHGIRVAAGMGVAHGERVLPPRRGPLAYW